MTDLERLGRHVGESRKLDTPPFRWRTPWNDADPVGSAIARERELAQYVQEQLDRAFWRSLLSNLATQP